MDTPKLPESGEKKNDIGQALSQLAKEIFKGKSKEVDDRLNELTHAFDTDPEASLEPYEMEAKQATAVVNFIRSLFDMEPVKDGEEVNLEKMVTTENGKVPSLDLGGKKVRFNQLNFSGIKDQGERVVQAALSSIAMKDNLSGKHCWDWVNKIYKAAGVQPGEVLFAVDHYEGKGTFDEKMLISGAWVYYHNSNSSDKYGDHSGILESYDEVTGKGWVLSFPGPGKLPNRRQIDFKKMPIQRVQVPKESSNVA